ncbi:MAG: glycosyltransferase family 39 protein [Candidatus Aenigmatarchaeota archaeon]
MEFRKKWNNINNYTKYSLIIILSSLIIRFFLAFISIIGGDTCWHANVARYIANTGNIPIFEHLGRDFFWAPPLFHIFTAIVYKIFGPLGNIALNILPPIFGTLILLFSFLIIRKLFNAKIAFYSIIFFSFIPISLSVSSTPYVDTLLGFFVLASIYYALEKKIMISSFFMGFGILTKYNAVFAIPAIFYIIYVNSKEIRKIFIKNIILFLFIAFAISSIWFLRNFYIFRNPIWPFFNNIFQGYPTIDETKIKFSINDLSRFYLETFGVPEGNLYNLQMVGNNFIIFVWILLTIAFIIPFFIGLKNIKNKKSFNIINLILLFFILQQILVYIYAGFISPRWMIVAFISISIYWAFGLDYLISKFCKYKTIIFSTTIIIIFGFIFSMIERNIYANNLWRPYQEDFDWIKKNTEKDALILAPPGQCYSFNLERFTVTTRYGNENRVLITDEYIDKNIDYIFSTKKSIVTSEFDETIKDKFSKYKILYNNNKTGTVIYKVR